MINLAGLKLKQKPIHIRFEFYFQTSPKSRQKIRQLNEKVDLDIRFFIAPKGKPGLGRIHRAISLTVVRFPFV